MRKLVLLAAFIAISGCELDEKEDQKIFEAKLAFMTDEGIAFFKTTNNSLPSRSQIDAWYNEVRECVSTNGLGNAAPSPLPVITGTSGVQYATGELSIPEINAIYIEYRHIMKAYIYKHAFLHLILHANGIDMEDNSAHEPAFIWGVCNPGSL